MKAAKRDWSAPRTDTKPTATDSSLLIRGARVLDAARGFDGRADVGIRDDRIDAVDARLDA